MNAEIETKMRAVEYSWQYDDQSLRKPVQDAYVAGVHSVDEYVKRHEEVFYKMHEKNHEQWLTITELRKVIEELQKHRNTFICAKHELPIEGEQIVVSWKLKNGVRCYETAVARIENGKIIFGNADIDYWQPIKEID